jgi:sialate O-acetylesterase
MIKNIKTILLLFAAYQISYAEVTLPNIFGDDMVLQRESQVKLWGWGNPSEEITITTSWDKKKYVVKTKNNTKWEVHVNTPQAGGPFMISFKGDSNEIKLNNILIGEVWLCSGQSNMEWNADRGIDNAKEEIKKANYPNIRFFKQNIRTANSPQEELSGNWEICTPESMRKFSAVAYFFSRRLQDEISIPIGLIDASWGGTSAEVWTPAVVFEEQNELKEASLLLKETEWWPNEPSIIYNAMIAPITQFKIAGALWYQGESNTQNANTYQKLFTSMITSWRAKWGYNFPFYYVQIAPFEYEEPEVGVIVRNEQRKSMDLLNTGMVVVSDICTVDNIHPKNKQDVGLRLANIALKDHYKSLEGEVYGPLFKEIKIDGKKIEVIFEHAEGLTAKGKKVTYFEIAGEDDQFYPANASIKNDKIVLSSKNVKEPKKVRYAWSNTALPNLFNSAGLPASSFISE